MKIRVRTGGAFGDYLPEGAAGNRAVLDVAQPATPASVLAHLGIPADEPCLISVNGTVVPPSALAEQQLDTDDEVAILPALRGG